MRGREAGKKKAAVSLSLNVARRFLGRSCNVLKGASWVEKNKQTCDCLVAKEAVDVLVIFLPDFKAASHLPALVW